MEMINERDRLSQRVKETHLGRTPNDPNMSDTVVDSVDEGAFSELIIHAYLYGKIEWRIRCRNAIVESVFQQRYGVRRGKLYLGCINIRDWKMLIEEGVPMDGILEDVCKVGINTKMRYKKSAQYRRDPNCRRRRAYMRIADIGEWLIPHEKDLTKCFLTACQHNPYLAMRLAYFADIHAVTRTGMNAVSLAVAHGFPILAVQLIDLGVSPFKKNHRGMNAFDFVQKTYSVNKVVKYGLRHAVKRRQDRLSVYKILANGFQDCIVAGIVMEYLPIQTQYKIECWRKTCWSWGLNCWQCSLIDDKCPFPFYYRPLSSVHSNPKMEKRYRKYIETAEALKALHGDWRCIGEDSLIRYHFHPKGITNLSPPVDSIAFKGNYIVVRQASVTYEGYFDKMNMTISWDNGDEWTRAGHHSLYKGRHVYLIESQRIRRETT